MSLLDNLPIIANFSAMVMRNPSTSYLANQNATYKSLVLKRFKPLLPNEETFEDMFTTMTKENDCQSEDPPVVRITIFWQLSEYKMQEIMQYNSICNHSLFYR